MTALVSTFSARSLRRLSDWINRPVVARALALTLTAAAILSGFATYLALTRSPPLGPDPDTVLILLNVDLVVLLAMGALVARRIARVWADRRRGSAGSRLHVRLVVLFSLVAVTPAVIVAVFSALFFNFGIQAWFGERVRTALHESLAVTDKYLEEHQGAIRADVLAMAAELNRNSPLLTQSLALFQRHVVEQAAARLLPEAIVFDGSGRLLARTTLSFGLQLEPVPDRAMEQARRGEVAILLNPSDNRVRALTRLDQFFDTYLYVGRFIDSVVLGHVARTQKAVEEYERLEGRSSGLQISFIMIYAVVTLLLLLAAVWVGLMMADQMAGPISALIAAAERVRGGDLTARVEVSSSDDEFATLSRAFNRMTDQLQRHREDLVAANSQLDARRKFTETVLAGVSAGVIGLDAKGRINLPNRSASELLSDNLERRIGEKLADAVPEMAALLEDVRRAPDHVRQGQLDITRDGRARTLIVTIAAERINKKIVGYVVTFDDVSELLSAQRKAAWSDIARRIAHEIKNPLTPIQLSAERLKRKYLSQIKTDREAFEICTNTIVRQVGDIGRMVDEFSAFARMPAPVMKPANLSEICVQALFLQRSAHSEIDFVTEFPARAAKLRCDSRQVGQAVTNLLQNAVDSILDRMAGSKQSSSGKIVLRVGRAKQRTVIEVEDDGVGLPVDLMHSLTEPYVTTRSKGTGLGLAIVRKIMEDHGGELVLENREQGGARVRLIFAPEPAKTSASKASAPGKKARKRVLTAAK